jgi:hypothetical protein
MQQSNFPWRTAILGIVVVIIALLIWHFASKSRDDVRNTVTTIADVVKKTAPEIAEKFKTGRITETFRESVIQVKSTGGDILELATSRNDETFTRSEENKAFRGYLNLGTTTSEIRVPVTFRYHLRLSDPWTLEARSNVCRVLAPPIRPSLPPALHTDQMVKRTESGWAEFNSQQKMQELEKTITPKLNERAMDETHLALVREQCRKSVAEFVKAWLMKEDYWRTDGFSSIIVRFPDEKAQGAVPAFSDQPTIRLENAK